MNIPQIIFTLLIVLGTGMIIGQHGQPKKGIENGWTALVSMFIILGLLWWGGFYG